MKGNYICILSKLFLGSVCVKRERDRDREPKINETIHLYPFKPFLGSGCDSDRHDFVIVSRQSTGKNCPKTKITQWRD